MQKHNTHTSVQYRVASDNYDTFISRVSQKMCNIEIEPLPYDIEQGLLNSPQHHRMTALLRKKFAHV